MTDLNARLAELGLTLPEVLPIHGKYRTVVVRGDIAYTSGVIATVGPPLAVAFPGQVGGDVSLDDAKESARLCVAATLTNLSATLGGLDRVESFLHITGYVNVAPGFAKVHHVVGAANELIAALFGDDAGLCARTAVGVAVNPENASVVLDAVVALRP
jgi:enamine deaminase RidA (YjgF/YER057c/UK114 family)